MWQQKSEITESVKRNSHSSLSSIATLLVCILSIPVFTSCLISIQIPLEQTYIDTQSDEYKKERLLQKAQERGYALIIVTWRLDEYRSVQQILDELETKNLNISVGRIMRHSPRTSLTVDKEALIYLYNSDKVERIDENRSNISRANENKVFQLNTNTTGQADFH